MIRKTNKWLRQLFGLAEDGLPFKLPAGMLLGDGCRILDVPRIKIASGAQVICSKGVVLNSSPSGYHTGMAFPVTLIADRDGARIVIGTESRLHGCCIHAWSQVTLGRKCLVAAGAQILDSHGHAGELEFARLRTQLQDRPEPITLGDFCWVGLNAVVLKGVNLGEGCIVSTNSVVTSGIYPPFSLLMGNPAQVVRQVAPAEVLAEDTDLSKIDLTGKLPYHY